MTTVEGKDAGKAYLPSLARTPLGAAVVVRSAMGILMLKRHGAHGAGTWGLPGGWVEPGEDPAAAAKREAWEEVGLQVTDTFWLGYTTDRHPEGLDQVTMWFEAFEWEGEPRNTNPARVSEVRWWTPDEIRVPTERLFVPVLNGISKGIFP